jgi:uncharacterized lipoprotein
MTYRTALRSAFLPVVGTLVLFLLAGCSSGESPDGRETGEAAEGQTAAERAGTLVLDETTYQVQLRA